MIEYALKNIRVKIGRSLSTIMAIALLTALAGTITGIARSQIRTVNEHAAASAGKIHVQPRLAGETYPADGIDLREDVARRILERDDLQRGLSAPVLYAALEPPRFPTEPPRLVLTGIEAGSEAAFTGSVGNDLRPVMGVERFAESDAAFPAILGSNAAAYFRETLGSEPVPGSTIVALGREWAVIGVLEAGPDLVVGNSVIVPLALAQEATGKEGFVSSVIVVPAAVAGEDALNADIESRFPGLAAFGGGVLRRNLREGLRVFEDMVNAIAAAALIAAVLILSLIMTGSVRERTKEIGLLRALGVPSARIAFTFFQEILVLALFGAATGCVAAGLVLRFGLMENLFDPAHLARIFALFVPAALLPGLAAVFSVSRIEAAEALRYE